MPFKVTREDVEAFERDGAICLRGMYDAATIDLLNRGVDRNIAEPGRYFTDFTAPNSRGRCIKEYWSWERIPEYQEFLRDGPAGAVAGQLMQCREVRWLEDQYFQKEAGASTPSPWHQDQPYYELGGDWIIFWAALDGCDADDALNFVAGSHASGQLYKAKNFSETGAAYHVDEEDRRLESLPDIGEEPDHWRILRWAVEPGDVLAFHPRTVHGNRGNFGDRRARRFVARFISENAYYDQGVFPWASMIDGHGLEKGALLRGPKFPVVWSADERASVG